MEDDLIKKRGHIIKSNEPVIKNHLWIPDNIIIPKLSMLNNIYFDSLKQYPLEDINILLID